MRKKTRDIFINQHSLAPLSRPSFSGDTQPHTPAHNKETLAKRNTKLAKVIITNGKQPPDMIKLLVVTFKCVSV